MSQNGGHSAEEDAEIIRPDVRKLPERQGIFAAARLDREAGAADNDTIYLQGFGQFEVKKKAERISVNPANGKRYLVPPKLVPVFKPGTTVKNRLKELGDHE